MYLVQWSFRPGTPLGGKDGRGNYKSLHKFKKHALEQYRNYKEAGKDMGIEVELYRLTKIKVEDT